jgi:hypothetical protein
MYNVHDYAYACPVHDNECTGHDYECTDLMQFMIMNALTMIINALA